eukprot:7389342-Prymnesium_polylepis.1
MACCGWTLLASNHASLSAGSCSTLYWLFFSSGRSFCAYSVLRRCRMAVSLSPAVEDPKPYMPSVVLCATGSATASTSSRRLIVCLRTRHRQAS